VKIIGAKEDVFLADMLLKVTVSFVHGSYGWLDLWWLAVKRFAGVGWHGALN
jgi:hypothetical protein